MSAARSPGGGQVRIIGGRWRGTRLDVADSPGLRPTSDRVRETLFNWLQPVLPGARVLDLFAGSGALGLESVSRGASEAMLVEREPRLVALLHGSVQRLDAAANVHVVQADARAWLQLPVHGRFDVVFIDPPFADATHAAVLAALPAWLQEDAWLYVESPLHAAAHAGPGWLPHRRGETREVAYALYRRAR